MTVRDLTRPTAGAKGPVSAVFSRRFGPLCAMKEQLQAIVTVLSLVNPAICGAMFAQIEANRSRGQQLADATKAAGDDGDTHCLRTHRNPVAPPVRCVPRCLHGGRRRCAGMDGLFHAERSSNLIDSGNAPPNSGASLTPLILFAASPGTITGVITLSAAHTGLDLPVTALVAIAVAGLVTWLVLLLVSRVAAKASEGGSARDMITRFMGLIVLSMGVQFALTGLHKFGT